MQEFDRSINHILIAAELLITRDSGFQFGSDVLDQ